MATKPFLTPTNIFKAYREARDYTLVLNEQFEEFQRISRNEPHPDLAPKFPRLAEGSTAAWLHQKPRQLIQQTPSGLATSETQEEWLQTFANWVLPNEIIANANEDYPVFEKTQVNAQDALTFGCKVTTAPMYEHDNGKYSPDMSGAFWGDLTVPQGYNSIKEMPYVFIEGWWPHERVKQMVNNPDLVKGGWNMENLKTLLNEDNTKGERSETPTEKRLGLPQHYAHVVVAFQEGVKAPIYTFSPEGDLLLRTKPNPDPRGTKNIQVLYGLIDGTNPFGYSVVAMVGAWQNLMDNDAQAYQYNRAYNVDPAILKKGSIGDGDLHPGAAFEALGENDGIDTIPLDTNALETFPDLYNWQREVLMNLLNSPTSAGDDVAPLGTTPRGIAQAASNISTDDLTFIQHIHDWFGDWAETALNIYFAEMKGVHSFTLDDKTAQSLLQLQADGKVTWPITNSKGEVLASLQGNVFTLDFDNTTFPILRFNVKGGSSKLQDEAQQLAALQQLQETISSSPELTSLTGQITLARIYNKIVTLSGIHDDDDLLINIEQLEQQEEQASEQSDYTQKAEEAKPPAVTIAYKDLEPAARVEALKSYGINLTLDQLNPPAKSNSKVSTQAVGAHNAITKLKAKGVPDAVTGPALEALADNVPLEHIVSAVQPQGA